MTHPRHPHRATRLRSLPVLLAALLFFSATPRIGHAQSWSLGFTAYGEAESGPQAELLLERQFKPFANIGKWSIAPGVGARISDNTGSWVGGGLVASRLFGDQRWRFDAGLMPGYYSQGDKGNDLGSDLEFRSFLSLGREVSDGYFVALEIEHMSNGGLGSENPGDNRLLLRLMKLDLN